MRFKKRQSQRSPKLDGMKRSRTYSQNYYRGERRLEKRNTQTLSPRPSIEQEGQTSRFGRVLSFAGRHFLTILILLAISGLLLVNITIGKAVFIDAPADNPYRDSEIYVQAAQDILNENVSFMTKVTFQSEDYEQRFIERFPEVSSLSAVVPIAGRELQLSMKMQEPVAVLMADNNEYYVTQSGQIVETPKANTEYPIISLQEPPRITNGGQLLTSSEAELINLLSREFDGSSSVRPKLASILYDIRKREMQVRFRDVPYYAKVTSEAEAGEQVGALVATIADVGENKIAAPNSYIDARVPGRVFVR